MHAPGALLMSNVYARTIGSASPSENHGWTPAWQMASYFGKPWRQGGLNEPISTLAHSRSVPQSEAKALCTRGFCAISQAAASSSLCGAAAAVSCGVPKKAMCWKGLGLACGGVRYHPSGSSGA